MTEPDQSTHHESNNLPSQAGGIEASTRKRLIARLQGANVSTDCCIELTGKESRVDHNDPAHQYPLTHIRGNYGVMLVGKLGFVDIDVQDLSELPDEVQELKNQEDTFTTCSPHGGYHLYYRVQGDVSNSKEWWGEIRTNSWYVVGPGSTIDHADCGDDCGCVGEGRYRIDTDTEIRSIQGDVLEGLKESEAPKTTKIDPEDVVSSFDGSVAGRLGYATDRDEKFMILYNWACGNRGLFGISYSDRSSAECALTQKLLWWYEWDTETVREILDTIQPPKWHYRGERYRQSVIQAGLDYTAELGAKYDPDSGTSGVSFEAGTWVLIAVDDLIEDSKPRVKTSEVVDHWLVRVKEDQVRKVLDDLKEAGYVEYERQGRSGHWIVHDLPATDNPEFFRDYLLPDELDKQRAIYLSTNPG